VPFQKVRATKVSAVVAEQIVEAIKTGVYPVGSRLPSEAELAQATGVSRASVREALSALQAVGLIEAKSGSGNYVRKSPTQEDEADVPLLLESEAGCLEVMEARETLEPSVVALVATKANPKVVRDLRRAIEEMRSEIRSDDFAHYFQADKRFHLALVAAAGNRLISAALVPLISTMDQTLYREFTHRYYLKTAEDLEPVVDLHEELVRAIEKKDPETASAAMSEHWRRMRETSNA
jgi:GntR family transcriptional repressor for pyruvate dehydrogenase complex